MLEKLLTEIGSKMAPLNYAQKALLWFVFCSLALEGLIFVVVFSKAFLKLGIFVLLLLCLSAVVIEIFLALSLGRRITGKMLFESRLRHRLKVMKDAHDFHEAKNQEILDVLVESVIIVDENNRICTLNRAARRFLDSENKLKFASLAEAIREPEIHELLFMAREENQEISRIINVSIHGAGKLWAKVTPIGDKKFMLSCLDIGQFVALDERHKDFIAHASHELKTPIAVILANAEIMVDEPYDDGVHLKLVHAIQRQALRAQKLLDSLLELLRLNAGHYEAKQEEVDLGQFVDEVKKSLGQVGEIINNDIGYKTFIYTDRVLLERLMHIVIENTYKYAGANARLVIKARREEDSLGLLFVDNGPGIKNHLRERVFDQFFRATQKESDKDGFGLGLAHARAIATALGGRIGVLDTRAPGCTVTFSLPSGATRTRMPHDAP
jgi:signal transduction histidine kinase